MDWIVEELSFGGFEYNLIFLFLFINLERLKVSCFKAILLKTEIYYCVSYLRMNSKVFHTSELVEEAIDRWLFLKRKME